MPDIEALVAQMTIEEKAALCTGATAWTTTPEERLGVPELYVSDGPHGVRRVAEATSMAIEALASTCFPTASCLAASWDTDLARRMGEALGEEASALDVDVLLGPGVNMKRTPVCGRNFEYFAEDPFLAGKLAAALIDGIQSKGVGTSLKHFAANNQEHERMTINALVDERTLREIYLPAFEIAVKEAQPWTVMCAYNRLNGLYASENRTLLVDILKEEWGFEGFVVSDWGAVHDRVAALQSGLDLEMPGPRPRRTREVVAAVREGRLAESVLDDSVRRILRIVFLAAETPKGAPFAAAEHHALARKIAGEGMVLLKNDGILPLKNPGRIAVIGRAAQEPHFQGHGSSHITPTMVDVPYVELQKLAGGAQLSYSAGYPADDSSRPDLIEEAVAAAKAADVALLYIALPTSKESEGYDRADLDLTAHQVALIRAVTAAQGRSVVILNNGSAVTMAAWIDGAAAVLEAWMMGQAGGGAIADILFGVVNPSGKLAETFPLQLADTPAYLNHPGEYGSVAYGERLFIGYRFYDAAARPVLFHFGHGLNYTSFAYGEAQVSAPSFRDMDGVTVSVAVTNTGSVPGKEIVQVYVGDRAAGLPRPPKELKGFAKVELEPGETKTVTIPLDFRAFAFYHPGYGQWITEDGEFDILVGASAADIRGAATVVLQSTLDLPSLLTPMSTPRQWLADKRGKEVFAPFFDQLLLALAANFAPDPDAEIEGLNPDALGYILDMPLPDVLDFQGDALGAPPREIVAGLLAQVRAPFSA